MFSSFLCLLLLVCVRARGGVVHGISSGFDGQDPEREQSVPATSESSRRCNEFGAAAAAAAAAATAATAVMSLT